ncbi:hypothetical protein [Brevundimonas sp. TWP2-3-2]|uniref:hypothetical protein n=1 Tax=unclassified Brevundimonas TaxID=2622653 RepID=UPI003CFB11B3
MTASLVPEPHFQPQDLGYASRPVRTDGSRRLAGHGLALLFSSIAWSTLAAIAVFVL